MKNDKLTLLIKAMGNTMESKKLASIISYFSITQGIESNKTPNLSYFAHKDRPQFKNWAKSQLNFLGFNVELYNEGLTTFKILKEISTPEIESALFEKVKSISAKERWSFLKGEAFKVHITYNDELCWCKLDKNGTISRPLNDREVFIDLCSLAKFAKAIQLHLKYDDSYYDKILDTVVELAFLHEKYHVNDRKLHDRINSVIEFREEHSGPLNMITAMHILKLYLKHEYDAWESARVITKGFFIQHTVGTALCYMCLASTVTLWMKELYEEGKVNLYPGNVNFDVDFTIANDRLLY